MIGYNGAVYRRYTDHSKSKGQKSMLSIHPKWRSEYERRVQDVGASKRDALSVFYALGVSLLFSIAECRSDEPARVVTVVSLADSGPGTLRDALKNGNRRIEFKVGGEIKLKQILEVTEDNVIIDGTDAPRPGVTITGRPFALHGARDVQLKNLRFRDGDDDNLRIIGPCRNLLIENCSSTHAGDGAIDITHDYKTLARPYGVTIRNCLIAATDKAMLVVGADNLTLVSNLFTNNGQRNPQLHDARNFNVVNNVVRNFTVYGFRARAGSTGNTVGNLFPLSPLKPKRPDRTFLIDQSSGACRIYTRGNIGPEGHDPNELGTSARPIGELPAKIHPATALDKTLIDLVGARPLDRIDSELVKNDPSIDFRPSNTKDK